MSSDVSMLLLGGGAAVLLSALTYPARRNPAVLTLLAGLIVICLFIALIGLAQGLSAV